MQLRQYPIGMLLIMLEQRQVVYKGNFVNNKGIITRQSPCLSSPQMASEQRLIAANRAPGGESSRT